MNANAVLNPRRPEFWLLAAVIATIVGDIALEVLTGQFLEWDKREWLTKPLLLAIALVITLGYGPRVAALIRRNKETSTIESLDDIKTAPVLIVLVSTNPSGGFTTARTTFSKNPGSLLKHIFLVHSTTPESVDNATSLCGEINTVGSTYKAHMEDLQADFLDMEAVKEATHLAIRRALELQDVEAKDIVVDITGGSSVASAGAVLAAMEVDDVTVTYIPEEAPRKPGSVAKRINVRFGDPV